MTATVTGKLLELVDEANLGVDEVCSIKISAPHYRELMLEHPMCKLSFNSPIRILNEDSFSRSLKCTELDKNPAHVGDKITTGLVQKRDLLGRFELDDRNFPSKGTHTQIEIEFLENAACLTIRQNDQNESLIFNRINDYYHEVVASK